MGRGQADREPDFADVLGASIDRWYGSRRAFAAKAMVAEATISRYVNRESMPDRARMERIAPHILDERGRPVPIAQLLALVNPDLAPAGRPASPIRRLHRLALQVDELLGEGSTMPEGKRADLEPLLESLLRPYARYLTRSPNRKAG